MSYAEEVWWDSKHRPFRDHRIEILSQMSFVVPHPRQMLKPGVWVARNSKGGYHLELRQSVERQLDLMHRRDIV